MVEDGCRVCRRVQAEGIQVLSLITRDPHSLSEHANAQEREKWAAAVRVSLADSRTYLAAYFLASVRILASDFARELENVLYICVAAMILVLKVQPCNSVQDTHYVYMYMRYTWSCTHCASHLSSVIHRLRMLFNIPGTMQHIDSCVMSHSRRLKPACAFLYVQLHLRLLPVRSCLT